MTGTDLMQRARDLIALPGFKARAALDEIRFGQGSMHCRLLPTGPVEDLRDVEFRVFSQFGQDGIIQYLVNHVPIERDTFVEFGVESYRQSNTRFLLDHDDWCGLVIDGGTEHLRFLERSGLRWQHQIDGVSAFITRENINKLIADAGIVGDIGLLSIDLDGNDYWILDAIDVVSPRILIVEYNSLFGPERAVTIPYDPSFFYGDAHHSKLYYGASLPALVRLAGSKGYRFVGSNRAGNDAFFVRDDVAHDLPDLTAADGWVDRRFRSACGEDGRLTYVSGRDRQLAIIGHLPLVDVEAGSSMRVDDLR